MLDPYRSDLSCFNEPARLKLQRFLHKVRSGAIEHPAAAFDFDGTTCRKDIAEAFLKWSFDNHKLVDVDYGRDIMREYHQRYQRNEEDGLRMAATAFKGLSAKKLHGWADDFAREYVRQKAYPMQLKLIEAMQESGVDTYVVSASPQFLVEAAAPYVGVAADHAIALRSEVRNGKMTGVVLPPITAHQGKVEAIEQFVGRPIDFAAGNSMSDYEMLSSARELALVINPKQELFKLAQGNHWAIQRWSATPR